MTNNRSAPITTAKKDPAPIGGRLAVDFANLKLVSSLDERSEEDFTRVVDFLVANGVVPPESKAALFNLWASAPDEALAFLERAGMLCGALRNAFEARAMGAEILQGWAEHINEILAFTEGHDRLEAVDGREEGEADWRLALHARAQGLEWLLTAIARNGAELITEGPRAPIRKCANRDCRLLFYDDSRTGRRRWCSMAVCGNRAKVAAHYRREKNKQ